ncbi:cadherin-related family member 5 [Salminus brasiliensis]|uniref:cadherin-related family member 5 n=1 Tax=Salminus brasiliensis TaxID=930266 RepID=UPI003B82F90C
MKQRPMDLKHLNFLRRTVFCVLVLFSINASGQLCPPQTSVLFNENNTIGAVVTTITVQDGVTLTMNTNPYGAFGIDGNNLVAVTVLDYETLPSPTLLVLLDCNKEGEPSASARIFVTVQNINDNPPVFAQSHYDLSVEELSAINTSITKIEATDPDKDTLYYSLISPMDEFGLLSNVNPVIQVKKVLDYDTTPEVSLILFAQDTAFSPPVTPSHTASTTITVTIIDINNRPPWFQPCTETLIGITTICLNSGYQGTVNLTEQATGALPLEPGPVLAIDGDKGRNEPINYRMLTGNEGDIFSINTINGDITMQKPVDVAGPIVLTVMAYEEQTPDMFATTTVTLQVVSKSMHPPVFVKSSYEGFISEDADVGSLVLEGKTSNKPLQVQATDADFANGMNPHITFEVLGSNDFGITAEGFILMTRSLAPGMTELQMRVVDSTNGEASTASLSVEVTPGVPTTTTDMPTTTTDTITSSAITSETITSSIVTTDTSAGTSVTSETVTSSIVTTDTSAGTSVTSETVTTQTTSNPETLTTFSSSNPSPQTDGLVGPVGDFKTEDMVALGVSLAAVLLLCLVTIGLLVYRLKRHDSDWKKLSEASIFRSTLTGGSNGPKDGVQYTNDGFQDDEDKGSLNSKEAAELPLPLGPGLNRSVPEKPKEENSGLALQDGSSKDTGSPLSDSSSLSPSDNTDSEKEVKPILTKERRMEDGYKAVWFKQDIDPNVKEEVVIIPDSGEKDVGQDDDDEDSEDEESVTDMNRSTRHRDSDSEDEEGLTSDL